MITNETVLLKDLISLLKSYLEDLSDVTDSPDKQFAYGEKTAYAECLEILSHWDKAKKYGISFDVGKSFPL